MKSTVESYVDADKRYSQALKELIYHKGPFSTWKILNKYGASAAQGVLKSLGWTTSRGRGGGAEWENNNKGSSWTGPIPEDDEELMEMVLKVRLGIREYGKGYRERKKKESMEQDYNAYRKLIERLAKGPGGFDTDALATEYEAWGQVSETLRELHWVKPRKGSTLEFWIGPIINTEYEAGKATRFLMQQTGRLSPDQQKVPEPERPSESVHALQKSVDHLLAENDRLRKENAALVSRVDDLASARYPLPAIPAMPQMPAIPKIPIDPWLNVTRPAHQGAVNITEPPRLPEVSILWGLIKWTRKP